ASTFIAGRTASADPTMPFAWLDEYLMTDADYFRCAKQIAQLEKQRDFLIANTNEPEKEPAYKRVIGDLEREKKTLATRRDEIRPRMIKHAREKYFGEIAGAKHTAQARIEFMTKLESILTKE